jgi:hypothetical protein
MADRSFIEDLARTTKRSDKIIHSLEFKRMVAFTIICTVIFALLTIDTVYWTAMQYY